MRYVPFILLAALLWLTGCAMHADPRLVGACYGAGDERLEFLPDTMVVHIRKADGHEERAWLGYFSPSRKDPYLFDSEGPDTSLYLGAKLRLNADYSVVTLTWGEPTKNPPVWQTAYRRKVNPN